MLRLLVLLAVVLARFAKTEEKDCVSDSQSFLEQIDTSENIQLCENAQLILINETVRLSEGQTIGITCSGEDCILRGGIWESRALSLHLRGLTILDGSLFDLIEGEVLFQYCHIEDTSIRIGGDSLFSEQGGSSSPASSLSNNTEPPLPSSLGPSPMPMKDQTNPFTPSQSQNPSSTDPQITNSSSSDSPSISPMPSTIDLMDASTSLQTPNLSSSDSPSTFESPNTTSTIPIGSKETNGTIAPVATLQGTSSPAPTQRDKSMFTQRRGLQQQQQDMSNLHVTFSACSIEDKNASVLIQQYAGTLQITNSTMVSNSAMLLSSRGGIVELDNSILHGEISIHPESRLAVNENNCGGASGCAGATIQTCSDDGSPCSQECALFTDGSCLETFSSAPVPTTDPPGTLWPSTLTPLSQGPSVGMFSDASLEPTRSNIPFPYLPTMQPSFSYGWAQCPGDQQIYGFSEVESLVFTIGTNQDSRIILCPETDFFGTLTISAALSTSVSVICGGENCRWIGGFRHVVIVGQVDVYFQGVTFREALERSVNIQSAANEEPTVKFVNCTWSHNKGFSTMRIHKTEEEGRSTSTNTNTLDRSNGPNRKRHHHPGGAMGERGLQDAGSLAVVIDSCLFDSNEALMDLIQVQGGAVMQIMNGTFFYNKVSQSLLNATTADNIILSESRFEANTVGGQTGVLNLGETKHSIDGETCGLYNFPENGDCNGILAGEVGVLFCKDLQECEVPCVGSLDVLRSSIRLINSFPPRIEVCPNTTFKLTETDGPIELTVDGAEIRCGSPGLLENQCIISGGLDQVLINATGVNLAGFHFVRSSRSSIRAEGSFDQSATISDCHFKGHEGFFVIVNSAGGIDLFNNFDRASIPETKSMKLRIESSSVQDNDVVLAPIVDIGGSIAVAGSVFQDNTGDVGALLSFLVSEVSLFSSCFLGNGGNTTVSLGSSSVLSRNDDNFGIGNTAAKCPGIDLGDTACVGFAARFCSSSAGIPSDVFTRYGPCISDYATLSEYLLLGAFSTIELCPGTNIDMGDKSPIQILYDNTTLKCGRDGSRLNSCKFDGGAHLQISGSLRGISIRGITFTRSTSSSVVVEGVAPLDVKFVGCAWESSRGNTALFLSSLDPESKAPSSAPSGNSSDLSGFNDDVFSSEEADFFKARLLGIDQDGVEVAFIQCSFNDNAVRTNLITSKNAVVNISSSLFSRNSMGGSAVDAEDGKLGVTKSCFEDNAILSSRGIVVGDETSGIVFESNYGSNNNLLSTGIDSFCQGLFYPRSGECRAFNSSFCEAAVDIPCISEWDNLAQVLEVSRAIEKGSTVTLCADSTLLADELMPLEINVENTVLRCGDTGSSNNRCVISGGGIQFRITGNVSGIQFRGVTFVASSTVAVHVAGRSETEAVFKDCIFANHKGLAAVLSYSGDIQDLVTSRLLLRRMLGHSAAFHGISPPDESPYLKSEGCIFTQNGVQYAPVAVLGGKADFHEAVFFANTGDFSALGLWLGGEARLSSSCFDSQQSQTPVFFDENSALVDSNTVSNPVLSTETQCVDGAFNGSHCFPFRRRVCAIDVDSITVVAPVEGCFEDWYMLAEAMTSESVRERDSILFTLCENTILNATGDVENAVTPILVNASDVTVRCGTSGSRAENCTIHGGRAHFKIEGTGTTLFQGVTFSGATFTSILATGESSGVATFEDCVWKQNTGKSVFLVHKEFFVGDIYFQNNFGFLSAPDGGSAMTVLLDRASFNGNQVEFAVMVNNGGSLNVLESLIAENGGSQLGVLAAFHNAKVGLSFNCISSNTARVRGMVYLDDTSNLVFHENSFALGNTVEEDDCVGIYFESAGSCLTSSNCVGICDAYEPRVCAARLFATESTLAPTEAPTDRPTQEPSAFDFNSTAAPSMQEEESSDVRNRALIATLIGIIIFLSCLPFVYYILHKRWGKTAIAEQPTEGIFDKVEVDPESSLMETHDWHGATFDDDGNDESNSTGDREDTALPATRTKTETGKDELGVVDQTTKQEAIEPADASQEGAPLSAAETKAEASRDELETVDQSTKQGDIGPVDTSAPTPDSDPGTHPPIPTSKPTPPPAASDVSPLLDSDTSRPSSPSLDSDASPPPDLSERGLAISSRTLSDGQ